nr:hypothetical protein [Corynebacterium lactis]
MTNKLPEEIYRRRRIAALVIIVVVIFALLWGISSLFSSSDTSSEQVNVTRDDGQTVTPSGKAAEPYKPSSEAKPKDDKAKDSSSSQTTEPDKKTDDAALAAKKDCSLADLQIKVTSDRPNYGTEQPKLAMTVHNPTGGECVVNLDEQKLRFEVFTLADYQRVWSDLDCNESEGKGELRLKPGEDAVYTAVWSRLSSAPNKCTEADRQPVAAGPYLFYGLIGDKNSDGYTFNLG